MDLKNILLEILNRLPGDNSDLASLVPQLATNKKIVDLDPITTQSGTDLKEVSLNGGGSRKETRNQDLAYINANAQLTGTAQVTGLNAKLPALTQGQIALGSAGANPVAGALTSSDESVTIDTSTVGSIDLKVSPEGKESLQDAYNIGSTITLDATRDLMVIEPASSTPANAIISPSTGVNMSSNYEIHAFSFIAPVSGYITAFQIEDANFNLGASVLLGVWDENEVLLAQDTVYKSDPLVGLFRTHVLATPLYIDAGVEYVMDAVVPPGQTYRSLATAVPASGFTVPRYGVGNSQPTPIPLSYPTSFTSTPDVVPIGAFQFEELNVASDFNFTADPTKPYLYSANSTTKGGIPWPQMTLAQRDAIMPVDGLTIWTSDSTPPGPCVYNGEWVPLIDSPQPDDAAWAQVCLTPSTVVTFSDLNFKPINVAVSSSDLNAFTVNASTGQLTYTGGETKRFTATFTFSGASSTGLIADYELAIGENGNIITASKQRMDYVNSAVLNGSVKTQVTLSTGDTIQPFIRPTVSSTTSYLSEYGVFTLEPVTEFSTGTVLPVESDDYVPTLTPVSGITGSITLNNARYIKVGSETIVTLNVSLTANNSAIVFGVASPAGGAISATSDVTLMGGILTTASPNVGDGNIVSAVGDTVNSRIQITANATVSSGTKILSFSFMVKQ